MILAAVTPLAAQAATAPSSGPSAVASTPTSSWMFNGRVRASVIAGNTAYVGGEFTQALPPAGATDTTPVTRSHLAAIDLQSGSLLPWDPGADGLVWALAASPDGTTVYAGGDFANVGGTGRSHLAALDAASGSALSTWNPGTTGRVRAIVAQSTLVYVGGQFTQLAGKGPGRLGRVSAATGALDTTWRVAVTQIKAGQPDPSTGGTAQCPPRCTPAVTALAIANTGDLYVGGHFGLVNGVYRNQGAEVSSTTGQVLQWDPNVFVGDPNNPNQKNYIYDIAVSPAGSSHPNRVFLCGDYYSAGGNTSPNVSASDATTGAYDVHWRASTDGGTPACTLGPGDTLYIGGHFRLVGGRRAKYEGISRNHAAGLLAADPPLQPADPSTGSAACYCVYPNDWNPNLNSSLGTHTIATGLSAVVVGGDFTTVNGGKTAQQHVGIFSAPGVPGP